MRRAKPPSALRKTFFCTLFNKFTPIAILQLSFDNADVSLWQMETRANQSATARMDSCSLPGEPSRRRRSPYYSTRFFSDIKRTRFEKNKIVGIGDPPRKEVSIN
jgi:hypothetical protein